MNPARFEDLEAMRLEGLRRQHAFTSAAAAISEQWIDMLRINRSVVEVPCYGVMCGASGTGFEYMCGTRVESFKDTGELGRIVVPPQHYAVFLHVGGVTTLAHTWRDSLSWLGSDGYVSAHKPDFEFYPAGVSPLDAVDGIEIWLGVVSEFEPAGRAGC